MPSMKQTLSKEHLVDIAQQAVSKFRRLVAPAHDTLSDQQQKLLDTSKQVEDHWQKRRSVTEDCDVTEWAASFGYELIRQLRTARAGGGGEDAKSSDPVQKPLAESALLTCINAAHLLSCKGGLEVAGSFVHHSTVALLTQYFMSGSLSRKVREACAEALLDMASTNVALMRSMLAASLPFLQPSSTAASSRTSSPDTPPEDLAATTPAPAPSADELTTASSPEMQAYLCLLLVSALHHLRDNTNDRADSMCGALTTADEEGEVETRIMLYALRIAYEAINTSGSQACSGNAAASESKNGVQSVLCILRLCLVSGLLRGNTARKMLVLQHYSHEFVTLWLGAVARLPRMATSLAVPTAVTAKEQLVSLQPIHVWQSELLELLVEICSTNSFVRIRTVLCDEGRATAGPMISKGENATGAPDTSTPAVATQADSDLGTVVVTSPTTNNGGALPGEFGGVAGYGYEPLPAHWDTLVTSGGVFVWRLASALSGCAVLPEAVEVLKSCVVSLDTTNVVAETIYRFTITSLMLLCVANPRNVRVLSEGGFYECLMAVATGQQDSVFTDVIPVRLISGGAGREDRSIVSALTPASHLNANTTQLTLSLLCLMASSYLPRDIVVLMMRGVEKMARAPSCSTDTVIIEQLLHALASTLHPTSLLYFPGHGGVQCVTDRFTGRWNGYSFVAWIYPLCVWSGGSRVFTLVDSLGGCIAWSVVANGRTCCLSLTVRTAKEQSSFVLRNGTLQAETWSHIAITHNFSGATVYIGGRKLESMINVPFRKELAKRQRTEIQLGGIDGVPSFFGFTVGMTVLEGVLAEKDIARIVAHGPREGGLPASCNVLLSIHGDVSSVKAQPLYAPPSSVSVRGALTERGEGVVVQDVSGIELPNMSEVLVCPYIMEWALKTLQDSHQTPGFTLVAKHCIAFIATITHMTRSDAELDALLQHSYLERLKAEVLTWDEVFLDFAALMLAAATPWGANKTLRAHPSTQAILSIILEVLGHGAGVVGGGNTLPASCALRELSDRLVVADNVRLFQAVPGRFERVLCMSLQLPRECIKSVVVLIEKLCKDQTELEQALRFLLTAHTDQASANVAKAEIMRMLFDVARANVEMCDLVATCFKGNGMAFLVMLVHGLNHNKEAIRVFALRLLSLMQHVNKKLRSSFVKSHGFRVLSMAITQAASPIPISLATLDCLFKIAFDSYRPAERSDAVLASRLTGSKGRSRSFITRHHDATVAGGGGVSGTTMGSTGIALLGHYPGVNARRLTVTRREYSFEVTMDFARMDDPLRTDEVYHNKDSHHQLVVPLAFQTALSVLGCVVRAVNLSAAGGAGVPREESDLRECADWNTDERHAVMSEMTNSSNSHASPRVSMTAEAKAQPEHVVVTVLSYLEKVIDVGENGEALLPYPWLEWLWSAVEPAIVARYAGAPGEPSSPLALPLPPSRKFTSVVLTRTRGVIRRLILLDMRRNHKAKTVQRVRGEGTSPLLVRIVLEEVARYFSRSTQRELTDPIEANNLIRNLDLLFSNVETALKPFPSALGIEIVTAINFFAVSSNTSVRMRMKNHSSLFATRDHFAFFLLTTIRRYAKVTPKLLEQLADANAYDLESMSILLERLVRAVRARDVDEVEAQLRLIRHLVHTDEGQHDELFRIVGDDGADLARYLCAPQESLPLDAPAPLRTPGNGVHDGTEDSDSVAEEPRVVAGNRTPSETGYAMRPDLPIAEVVAWCQTHEGFCEVLKQNAQRIINGKKTSAKGHSDRVERDRASLLKVLRAEQERAEQDEMKATNEFARMRLDVLNVLGSTSMSSCA